MALTRGVQVESQDPCRSNEEGGLERNLQGKRQADRNEEPANVQPKEPRDCSREQRSIRREEKDSGKEREGEAELS